MLKTWYHEALDVEFNRENIETDTEYYIRLTDKVLHISFRLSSSVIDWKSNLSIWKKPYKHMTDEFYVHGGFLDKWLSVKDGILDFIRDSDVEVIKLRGFSQGSAMALLCHECVRYNFPEIKVDTVVFGCPRVFCFVGYDVVADRCSDIIRVENGNDWVTRLPYGFLGYKHVGKSIHVGVEYKWWKLCGSFGANHRPIRYLKSIIEYLKTHSVGR